MKLFTERENKILIFVIIMGAFCGFCEICGIIDKQITNPICSGEVIILSLSFFIALWRYIKKYEVNKE